MRFTHDGHEVVMTYLAGLPAFLVDGEPVPAGVVRGDAIEHVDAPPEFWEQAMKDWLNSDAGGDGS